MTLTVSAYRLDANGMQQEIPLTSNLAGLEAARSSFYGSAWARALGLVLLPTLEDAAVLEVVGEDLKSLQAEVGILRVAIKERDDENYWVSRLANISAAIEAAAEHGDCGCVVLA